MVPTLKKIIATILMGEARMILRKYKPKIIAVSGSVGKTSTKDAIYTVLMGHGHVRKSAKTYNTEIGIPLTILGRSNAWKNPLEWLKNILHGFRLIVWPINYPEWLVLEVGADKPGDIASLAHWLSPSIVVLTRFPELPVHVEFFETPEALHDEDYSIVRSLRHDGFLVVNADDPNITKRVVFPKSNVITYGWSEGSAFQATNYRLTYDSNNRPSGIAFDVASNQSKVPIVLPGVLGRQHVYPVLAAFAVASIQQLTPRESARAFKSHLTPPGRMRLLSGIKDTLIIDDTYNASPIALTEALSTLKDIQTEGRKIIVFGDMLELGKYTGDAHKGAGKEIANVVDIIVTVGIRARMAAVAANQEGFSKSNIFEFDDAYEAGKKVDELLRPGDVVLCKGSQSMRLERVVEAIMAEPDRKEELLARQDAEWLKKK